MGHTLIRRLARGRWSGWCWCGIGVGVGVVQVSNPNLDPDCQRYPDDDQAFVASCAHQASSLCDDMLVWHYDNWYLDLDLQASPMMW